MTILSPITYRLAIRRNADGRIHVTRWSQWPGDAQGLEYYLTEGNMACDCNRKCDFDLIADPDDSSDDPCGDGAYDIVRVDLPHKSFTLRELYEYSTSQC